MNSDQGTAGIAGSSASGPSEFATECNYFLRELGCQFTGDMPGIILEKMAEETRRLKSSNRSFIYRLSTEKCHFRYPGAFLKKPLETLWLILGLPAYKEISDRDFLASKGWAVGQMRVFRELANQPITDAREVALKYLERVAQRSHGEQGDHVDL